MSRMRSSKQPASWVKLSLVLKVIVSVYVMTILFDNEINIFKWYEKVSHLIAKIKPCQSNPFLMHSKIREARQFPFLTLSNSMFPMLQHGALELVPALTGANDEHFNPKWAKNPSTESPRSKHEIAVLSHMSEQGIRWLLFLFLQHSDRPPKYMPRQFTTPQNILKHSQGRHTRIGQQIHRVLLTAFSSHIL